ncbi:pilus assembly protein PilM [Microbacterium sp. Sa4CUA7]|uniref:Pilus assembly protein PilM n=1 Tax=Microbacterium pullorum TaxID=2762236 RepID=A0ABR8S3Q9_9MICO|nr:pilus assembly protein PilM [Microbacterium pullorum]MBD7958085.1 pilus assembly protein PilM [Microbacterium pullorum]
MAKTIVGLEITEEGVRAAEVTVGRRPVLVAGGSVPLPPGAAKDSEVFDRDAVALALRQLWSRTGIKNRRVVLGLGSRRILVREYTTTAMRPDLLRQALPFQVQDLLPVPPEQAVLDFYPLAQQSDQVTGLLVATVAETVEDLIATVAKAKLTVDVVDLAPFGLARAVSRVARPGETVAAFHLGDHTSFVVVLRDGVPRFVRMIPIDITTQAVRNRESAALGDSADLAAPADEPLAVVPSGDGPLTRRRAGARVTQRPSAMSDVAIADLVARLRSTLTFYADRSGEQPVTRVLLTGAGAAVPGIAEALAGSLPLEVESVPASQIVDVKGDPPEGDDALDLLATVGLALGEVRR